MTSPENVRMAETSILNLMDGPRIRHITGIQIHQLCVHPNVERPKLLRARSTSRGSLEHSTLANGSSRHGRKSSFGASNVIQEDKPLHSSPDTAGPLTHARQASASSRLRTSSEASSSSSTFRGSRARASTLIAPEIHTSAEEQRELGDFVRHQLARSFVAFYATTGPRVPFFLSTIHRPSTQPSFLGLDADADFAPWLDVAQGADGKVDVEVWVEVLDVGQEKPRWRRMKEAGGRIAFQDLKLVDSQTPKLADNTLLFTFSSHPNSRFYLPSRAGRKQDAAPQEERASDADRKRRLALGRDIVRTAVERSLRETRMKQGAGVGALHEFVNMQAVVADTKRGVEEMRTKVDALLLSPKDKATPRRDVAERKARIRWLEQQVEGVKRSTEEAHARIVLRRHALDERRVLLAKAIENEALLHGKCETLRMEIDDKIDEKIGFEPAIHAKRAALTQTLDNLFPIEPLDPASLLYTILGVPLPIPVGSKDPAPPLTIPSNLLPTGMGKVDEESTATALGYAAMVVSLLGTVTDRQVPYPVTCAGSRSVVKDLVSVMQGPRSFPLYAKGVERYRYEYAVFLLNKDIEMLMLDCNIRTLDIRHTLPNLKNLLLTLSSPMPLPALSQSLNSTRPSSRQGTHSASRAQANLSQMALGLGSSPLAHRRPLTDGDEVDLTSVSDGNLDEKEAAAAVEDVSGYAP